jgi:hypothetical protein
MYYGVTESIGFLRASGVQFALLQLLVGIAVGAVTYVVATAALWCLVGRPVGAESLSYGWIRARLAKRFRLGSS